MKSVQDHGRHSNDVAVNSICCWRVNKLLLLSIIGLAVLQSQLVHANTQISKSGITWFLDRDYTVGQYVNGDWWVLDEGYGVTVSSVTPAAAGSASNFRNGSMINPVGPSRQGYDGRIYDYDSTLSVHFPVTLRAGNSLVSTESRSTTVSTPDVTGTNIVPTHGHLQRAAVLMVVSSVPNPNSFRPPYAGKNRPTYLTTDLRTDLLPKLSLSGKPDLAYLNSVSGYFENVWLDHKRGWTGRMMHPLSNMPNYGREIGHAVSQAAVLLTLDYTDEEVKPLLVNFVQVGIDLFAMSQTGTFWPGEGGHGNGRKWPILFAGIMLDHEGMKNVAVRFGEDDQTYYGVTPSANPEQDKVAYFGAQCSSPYQEKGCSGSGAKDCRPPSLDRDACRDYRNCCTSFTWVGQALAAQLMNQKDLWNHDAFFDYVDRWMVYGNDPKVGPGAYFQPGYTRASFIKDMWDVYRPQIGSGQPSKQPPIANAGEDQIVIDTDGDGAERIVLNASGSTDVDGMIISYVWTESGNQLATGRNPAVALTTGEHTITLAVTDDDGFKSTDSVTITINQMDMSVTVSKNSIEILFNTPMDASSAEDISHYTINKDISVTSASLSGENKKVTLFTSSHDTNVQYTVTITGVRDLTGNLIPETAISYEYDDGLVGFWEFDQSSGTRATNSSDDNNPGVLLNGPAWTGQGELRFDGIDDAVEIPTTNWNVSSGTVMLLAYAENFSPIQFFFGHTVGSYSNRIQLYAKNGSLCGGIGDSHTASTNIQALTLRTWYHIALTWDGTNFVVYLNGNEKASGSYSGLNTLNSFADIGNNGNVFYRDEALNGLIDDVRVYNRALTPNEILDISYKDRPFAFAPIGDKEVNENSTLTFIVNTWNPDTEVLIADHNLPSQPSFTENVFNWTPTYDDAGGYEATFTALQDTIEDSEQITITVNNVNRKPIIEPIGDKVVNENQTLTFTINATDPDGDVITCSAENLPAGADMWDNTFTWTPSSEQAGSHNVTFIASDGQSQDTQVVTIAVNRVNSAPVLEAIGNKTISEGRTLTFTVNATDPDGDALDYAALNLPKGATFNGNTFTWRPWYNQAGSYKMAFVTSDGQLYDYEIIKITVEDAEMPYWLKWWLGR